MSFQGDIDKVMEVLDHSSPSHYLIIHLCLNARVRFPCGEALKSGRTNVLSLIL